MEHLPIELREAFENDIKCCNDLELDKELINISDILKAYYILADYFTDPSAGQEREKMMVGVRSYNLLSSAVGRQCVEFDGKRKYTDKIDICSTLFFGLVKNHSFSIPPNSFFRLYLGIIVNIKIRLFLFFFYDIFRIIIVDGTNLHSCSFAGKNPGNNILKHKTLFR